VNLGQRCILVAATALLLSALTADAWGDEAADLSGKALFRRFCASCHGEQAKGDGPVAEYMRTPVPDLTQISKRNGGTFPDARVRRMIDGQATDLVHGPRDMPVWGWEFYAREGEDAARRRQVEIYLDRLTSYLRSIQQ
jgi:mono/diheme cytochrome c family protein